MNYKSERLQCAFKIFSYSSPIQRNSILRRAVRILDKYLLLQSFIWFNANWGETIETFANAEMKQRSLHCVHVTAPINPYISPGWRFHPVPLFHRIIYQANINSFPVMIKSRQTEFLINNRAFRAGNVGHRIVFTDVWLRLTRLVGRAHSIFQVEPLTPTKPWN